MSFPRYPKYKVSGVEWMGQVPEHWRIAKFRHHFIESPEKIETEVVGPMLSVSGYRGIEIKEYDDENRRRLDDELIGYRIVRPEQLVVNNMWLNAAGLGVSEYEGHVSPAYRAYWIDKALNRRFIHHLMRSGLYVQMYTKVAQGIRPNSLQVGRDDLMELPILLPDPPEQSLIAAFLDRETAKIDELVAQQRRLIELLKEKRQTVISHAVTKGLSPQAPMKPSGIEWLGDVPEHWEVAGVYFRYTIQLGKMLDTEKITGKHLRPYLRVFDVQWGTINVDELPEMDFDPTVRERFRLLPGDLLVNEGGSYPGRAAIWKGELDECYFQKALHRLRPCDPKKDTTSFFYYIMAWATAHGVFTAGGNESTIEHLPAEKFRKYRFAFPPFKEQLAIAEFLHEQLANFDALTAEAQRAIDLLQERRTALISAAVTGQIDVRGVTQSEAA
jgi:type I restriction enzyme, S subunit